MVSKACYVAGYRRKLEELASFPNVELMLMVPPYWRFGKKKAPLEPSTDRGYQMVVENPLFNGWHHLHLYPRLSHWVATFRPQILHVDEEPYDLVTYHALRVARRWRAKALFFTWQNIRLGFPPPFSFLERNVLARADAAIAGNQEAARVLREKGFLRPTFVIPQFGVDTAFFRPRDGEPGNTFRIGYVGRMVEEKGVFLLLEAVSEMGGPWELHLAGDGPALPRMVRWLSAKGLGDRFEWHGSVPSHQMPEFLSTLDVLVLPSLTRPRWKEQFGRVLVEAMACARPVVGSSSGEIPNVIGDAGLIFPEGNVEELRAHLFRLMGDPSWRRKLGQQGRQRVEERFTQRRVAELTYDVYRHLLEAP